MGRDELVELCRRIIEADGSEAELNEYLEVLERNTPHPSVSDLIYLPETGRDLDPETMGP